MKTLFVARWKKIRCSYPAISKRVDLFYNLLIVEQVYIDVWERKRWNGTIKQKRKIVAREKQPISITQLNF